MAQTLLGPNAVNTNSDLPTVGSAAPDFALVTADLKTVTLKDYVGKNIILNIFPSIDTNVCAASVHEFNTRAASFTDTIVLCVSKDLPFAFKRFCGAEGIDKVITVSDFRNKGFSKNYGVEMIDGAFEGLDARAIVVIDKLGKIKYTELVPQIGEEPNYEAAIKAI